MSKVLDAIRKREQAKIRPVPVKPKRSKKPEPPPDFGTQELGTSEVPTSG